MSWRQLKHFCEGPPQYGLNVGGGEYTDEGVRLLRTTDIQEHGALVPGKAGVFLPPDMVEPRYLLRKGDLLFSRAGSLGRCFRVATTTEPITFAGYLVRFRPLHDVDPRYLQYCAATRFFQGRIESDAVTSTISNFNAERYGNLLLPDRTQEEQRTIADFLDTETARIDALITKKRRMIDLLEERKIATMLAAAGGGLGHSSSFESSALPWLEKRPSHWGEVLLRLVATTGTGHTPSRERPDWWQDCTIPWITTGEVAQIRSDESETIRETREKISEVGLANSAAVLHPRGTVVLCRTASAGYSAIMGTAMATSQDFATWTCGPRLRPRFLLLCLRAMRPDLLGRLATGSTHKTIYMPDIHALRIPLPPLEEQDRAIELAGRSTLGIFAAMGRLRMQLDLLQERRQTLITVAVTGELKVPG